MLKGDDDSDDESVDTSSNWYWYSFLTGQQIKEQVVLEEQVLESASAFTLLTIFVMIWRKTLFLKYSELTSQM
ncbi:hypothetical protein DEO72_LG2g5401 [Vigna unguiculata]|uniref:Uncharacterized protein n=1 Tax=Vigna unguiculata TaxID=3917 RepID=A0A4D6L934_VIGUN|nr:hypothetical protein DEO72_LG2g5401 [Vigna unguiculata]